jgi:hypothetical protein
MIGHFHLEKDARDYAAWLNSRPAAPVGELNVPAGATLFINDGEPRLCTSADAWFRNSIGEIYSAQEVDPASFGIIQPVRRIDGPAAAPQAEPHAGSGKPRYHVGGKGNRVVLAENGDHFAWCNFEYQANAIAQALNARAAQAAELKQAKECEETFRKGFIESQTKRNAADQQAIWLRKEIESLQAQLAASARAVEALNFVEAEQISVWLCRGGESKPWSASKDTNLYGAGETPIDAILRLKALLTATGEGT